MLAAKVTPKTPSKTRAVSQGSRSKAGKAATPRGTLSQSLILRTALELIDSDGLAGLTVRKLAEQLGVSAMAIYRHYKSKAEIEQHLVDLVVGDNDVINHHEADWREWLYVTYAGMRSVLCAHPGVMPLLDNASYQGERALAVMERVLQELERAGLTPEQAAALFHMLMANMIGSVVLMNEEQRRLVAFGPEAAASTPQRKLSVEMVSLEPFPAIARLAPQLATLSEPQAFRDSVMRIIQGVVG